MTRIPWRVRLLFEGTVLGAIVLGAGGRLAMAAIQYRANASPQFTLGGTLTVVGLGAVSGLAGAAMLWISAVAANRVAPRFTAVRWAMFALLLALVTTRGLRGTPAPGRWYFPPLVALYGVVLASRYRERA
jgi:hypothetical protein